MIFALLLAASAPAFQIHRQSALLDFEYKWPSQASAIPALRRQLATQMEHDRSRYTNMARSDRAQRTDKNFPFFPYSFSRVLHFGGRTPRLVSFADERNAFTGGAHGNPSTQALLWDLAANKTAAFADLFVRSPKILQPAYCKQLARQRKQKTGTDEVISIWERCPDPLKLSIIPEDQDRNGRFETINVTANPYDVGSYAEGYYIVLLPVTPALLAALRPRYRSSFEVQRQ
ncbi:peptidoglycan-N-acetylmuramic acid deacetylase PdaC-like protein [Sphingomonas sp. F9_3S_D5_B_2]